jgi:acyl-[acyl-carrier-protein]-phospholipid O-acyltransferase / long-chain-fatty-acid--[acyl-carrier-protein] ligase
LFNMLPMFHSFGLTMGTLLPVLSGIKTVLYPSPLHYRIIPEMIYDRGATILFATNTFLAGYARCAHAYDLHSIRYIFAGAEKLRDATRALYNDKFGIRILEGYGVTEAAPVVAVNTPMHYQHGSVGRILPSMNTRIEPVEGITEGGRLLLSGPNIMLGYLKSDKPGVLQPAEAWYDTGDIVSIDDEGFIRILGRAKRFAKLGGEMVSLSAIESMVQDCWPKHLHAVISIHDDKKGEQLLLISENPDATVPVLISYAKKHGFPELMVPKKIIHQKELPVLGAGKVDYVTLQQNHATTH